MAAMVRHPAPAAPAAASGPDVGSAGSASLAAAGLGPADGLRGPGLSRRRLLGGAGLAGLLAACASIGRSPVAPTGTLRVGVYPGSPTSLVRDAAGQARGITVELGDELGRRLGVPVQRIEFPRLAAVLEALRNGAVDFTVTNASPARARDMAFSPPLLSLELGVLALPGSRVSSAVTMDQAGGRIGVSQGSSSQAALGQRLKQSRVVPAASLAEARQMLSRGEIDAFATNKGILFEMADALPGARVLDGAWGAEHLAIAIPLGREAALDEIRRFAADVTASGLLRGAAERAGLRGFVPAGGR